MNTLTNILIVGAVWIILGGVIGHYLGGYMKKRVDIWYPKVDDE